MHTHSFSLGDVEITLSRSDKLAARPGARKLSPLQWAQLIAAFAKLVADLLSQFFPGTAATDNGATAETVLDRSATSE